MDRTDFVKAFLQNAEDKHLKRNLRSVQPLSARECIVTDRTCLNFSGNDYLGLSCHPVVKARSIQWTEQYGAGATASRLVTGSLAPYLELEEKIAAWKGKEAALLFGSGYLANIGVLSALADRKSVVIADKLNHASLNAGCALSGATFSRYRHNDLDHLANLLQRVADSNRKILVSDTVFSMDGDVPDLDKLSQLADQHGALLYLDDAHATGVIGDIGEGLAQGCISDIAMGTFSKAMGSYGAYVACSNELKEYLVNKSGSFIYTTALPPGVCGAIDAAVELVQTDEIATRRRQLHQSCELVRQELAGMGFDTGNSATQIIPVILGDADRVIAASHALLDKGLLVVAIRPPTVPTGTARLRISLNATHTDSDIDQLLCAFRAISNLH